MLEDFTIETKPLCSLQKIPKETELKFDIVDSSPFRNSSVPLAKLLVIRNNATFKSSC